jgi:bifunctional non-homologous end joining protein LigD
MPLDEYKRKRNFARTPEPEGRVVSRKERGLFFCVQKHLASHLHYDFRLEHDGVLLSWAVPKGPSLDPKTKRLAMQTEDHPFDYGEFEGVIPEGYGAGIVMLWDKGTWTPEVPDVDAAIRKGDLKFTLNGFKLKGSWVLVRTGGRYPGARGGGDRSWLLIKHKDDWSGDLDIAAFAPLSVKTGGDFEDILAEDTPAIWQTNRPAKGGDTGAMLAKIIERAAKLKSERLVDAGSDSTLTRVRRTRREADSGTDAPPASPRKRSSKPASEPVSRRASRKAAEPSRRKAAAARTRKKP